MWGGVPRGEAERRTGWWCAGVHALRGWRIPLASVRSRSRMTTARPRLEKITAGNVLDACRLEVAPEQRRFVSPVARPPAEACVHPGLA
ncbi:hypothetical protein GA0115280_115831 [Streptomyces sp. Cmuel-A718b]|nr:hypothetical protein GA0115280_115831 [Streptomyces sp. Cmuel-A718b]